MDKERIMQKIIYFEETLFELHEIGKIEKDAFLSSKRDISATENYLRKAIQAMIDLADDIVSKKRLRALFVLL